jgi:hypothetical protein
MSIITLDGFLFDTWDIILNWLCDNVGEVIHTREAYNPAGYWGDEPWANVEHWAQNLADGSALRGDLGHMDGIDLCGGTGWTIIQTKQVKLDSNGMSRTTEFKTTIIIDDELLAIQFKLSVL